MVILHQWVPSVMGYRPPIILLPLRLVLNSSPGSLVVYLAMNSIRLPSDTPAKLDLSGECGTIQGTERAG